MDHDNRESWLNRVAIGMAPLFEAKKQATRLLKCECETCGYAVRTARKWLEEAGAPVCPAEGHGAMRHDLLNSDDYDAER